MLSWAWNEGQQLGTTVWALPWMARPVRQGQRRGDPDGMHLCAPWRRGGPTQRGTPREAWHTAATVCPLQSTATRVSADADWRPLDETGPPVSLLSCPPVSQTDPASVTRLRPSARLLRGGRRAAPPAMVLA